MTITENESESPSALAHNVLACGCLERSGVVSSQRQADGDDGLGALRQGRPEFSLGYESPLMCLAARSTWLYWEAETRAKPGSVRVHPQPQRRAKGTCFSAVGDLFMQGKEIPCLIQQHPPHGSSPEMSIGSM